ncbi:MAG: TonB-dependent receptor [Candidatus Thiodiazotropha sp. 6PLUC2]
MKYKPKSSDKPIHFDGLYTEIAQHPFTSSSRNLCISLFFILAQTATTGAFADTPVITDQQMREAEALFSGPGEDDYYRTDAVLVSATGSAKPVFLAPSVASVISKEEIQAMGARTLFEILETVPGVHISPSSNYGPLITNINIRGITTALNPQVLVLINGVQIKDLWNGNLGHRFEMPAEMISRVEVVRGPGSAVHGADAFAGTINIITKDGQEIDGARAGLRHGSFNTSNGWMQYGTNHQGWDLVASLEALKQGTDDERVIEQDLQSTLDESFGTEASLAPGAMNLDQRLINYHLGLSKDNWSARIWGLWQKDAGVGVGAAPVLDSEGSLEKDIYNLDLLYQNQDLHPDWALNFRFNYNYTDYINKFTLFPAGATLPIGADGNLNFNNPVGLTHFTEGYIGQPNSSNKTLGYEATGFYDGFANHHYRIATGYKKLTLEPHAKQNFGPGVIDGNQPVVDGDLTNVATPYLYGPSKTRHLRYLSLQDEWTLTRGWDLTLGARYDSYSDFGDTFNPRFALVWQTRYDLTTKLLYGQAFRPPSFSELYAQNNPVQLGNEALDPETIDTLELALDWRPTSDLRLATNLYAYQINDLIEAVPDADGASNTNQNARDQEGQGVEFEIEWQVNQALKLQANGAWQQSEDSDSGEEVANTPGFQYYARANWQFLPKWSLDSQWFWIGDRARAEGDSRPDIDDYQIVNLTLHRKQIMQYLDLTMAVRNLFDADVREPANSSIVNDYPMDSRGYWVTVEVRY